ncbi:DUF2798 domain-containing protein [Celeribacter ethanolicus]|uniref:DUF2798 domain-containing protein n=1 Tax=Celeribacter ethanolicus TaxID=1758178 RepID=UPI000B0F4FFC|nr:DUF2798 domain-containing protein [Celeribacter ethanolicus]
MMLDDRQRKKDKMTILLAQGFISCFMAFLMTLIMSELIPGLREGFRPGWVRDWLGHYITAWPIAFLLSMGVGPLAFFLSAQLVGRVYRS